MNVVLFVLGDLGRSPRMQYHAASVAELPGVKKVYLTGYAGEECFDCVQSEKKIQQVFMSTPAMKRWNLSKKLLPLYGPILVIQQIIQIIWVLCFKLDEYDFIMVQNPPSIPALFVVWIASLVKDAEIIIDWHNIGYSILKNNFSITGADNDMSLVQKIIVGAAEIYEKCFAHVGFRHLTVTTAMKSFLRDKFKLPKDKIITFYDKPTHQFKELSLKEKHVIFEKILDVNLFTEVTQNKVQFKKNRPLIIVSSTSYTLDEDFSILLRAFEVLSRDLGPMLQVSCYVTGKGPLKDFYAEKIKEFNSKFPNISVSQIWLEGGDYPRFIGCADVGVCLHNSTSGIDLPMKAVDMLGAKVPVLALKYRCIDELIRHRKNGVLFENHLDLALELKKIILEPSLLVEMKSGIQIGDWKTQWDSKVAQIFESRDQSRNDATFFKCLLLVLVLHVFAYFLRVYNQY